MFYICVFMNSFPTYVFCVIFGTNKPKILSNIMIIIINITNIDLFYGERAAIIKICGYSRMYVVKTGEICYHNSGQAQ